MTDRCSFVVHLDIKSQTSTVMSLSTGDVYSFSSQKKFDTIFPTKVGLVGANNTMPQIL